MLIQTSQGSISLVAGCCWVNATTPVRRRPVASGLPLLLRPWRWLAAVTGR